MSDDDRLNPWDPEDLEDDEDGEPDFTLDDLEWDEAYPELSEDLYCPFCGRDNLDNSIGGCPSCSPEVT
jgi:hypothetical protein